MNKSIPPSYSFLPSMVRTYKQPKTPIGTMQESMIRSNGTYTVNLGMMRIIATQDAGLIEYILKSNHRNYHKSRIQTEYLGKGLLTAIFYYGLHRDAKEWSDALSFKPSRFLKEHSKDIKKIYYPFGAGPRLCIGNNFAMAEMAIFLQSFIGMFHVSPGNVGPTIKPLATLRPDKVMLKMTKIV